jgi:hypothetical protein
MGPNAAVGELPNVNVDNVNVDNARDLTILNEDMDENYAELLKNADSSPFE